MYLADDYLRRQGVRNNTKIIFNTALGKIFGVDKYAAALNAQCDARNLERNFGWNLKAVRSQSKEAVFERVVDGKATEETKTWTYTMMHVTPPQGPRAFLAQSPLANAAGWVDVNQKTTQHTKYSNVFALGDCSSIPTSKTAAAVAAQCGVTKQNLRSAMTGMPLTEEYDGYTSCPLVLGRDSLLLAEFSGFTSAPQETFGAFIDQGKPSKLFYLLKRDVMPTMYWEGMLRNHWNGPGMFEKLFRGMAFTK